MNTFTKIFGTVGIIVACFASSIDFNNFNAYFSKGSSYIDNTTKTEYKIDDKVKDIYYDENSEKVYIIYKNNSVIILTDYTIKAD